MSEEDLFDRLMDNWEDARRQGQMISAADLCRDCPELLTKVTRQIAAELDWEACASSGPAVPERLQRIGRYTPLKKVGKGGMGQVFLARDERLRRTVIAGMTAAIAPSLSAAEPTFKLLALAETGGHHIAFTKAARPWLEKCGQENGFKVDYISDTSAITAEYLANYRLVLQLDFVPYGWKPEAQAAFRAYIENGKGGWVGLHHASLLGDFDGHKLWPWFSEFLGKIKYRNYIPTFAAGTVRVEDKSHPSMRGVPETFVIPREEWYVYDHSPRSNVRVLASVDESSYSPASTIKMGDHPVIWSNPHVAARNVYIFMGHGPDLLENRAFTTILRNAIVWAADK